MATRRHSRRVQPSASGQAATAKLDPEGPLWPLVTHMLGWYWSPQQIARTLKRM